MDAMPFKPSEGAEPTGRQGRKLPNPKQVERRARAVSLRVAGFSYRQIAADMGIDVKDAHTLVKRELEDTVDVTREQIREERQLEVARIEKLINKCWTRAFPADVDAPPDFEAIRTILRCMERKQKLLGLEAPQKHTVDMGHLQGQVALVVEMITRVIPDESVPKVYEAMEEAMVVIDRRERSLGTEEVA